MSSLREKSRRYRRHKITDLYCKTIYYGCCARFTREKSFTKGNYQYQFQLTHGHYWLVVMCNFTVDNIFYQNNYTVVLKLSVAASHLRFF